MLNLLSRLTGRMRYHPLIYKHRRVHLHAVRCRLLTHEHLEERLPLTSGIVGWWQAENNTVDSIGGNDGTFGSPSYSAGLVGNAFDFSASSSAVQINPANLSLDFGGDLTIEAWVYLSANNDNNGLVYRGNFAGTQGDFAFGFLSGINNQLVFRVNGQGFGGNYNGDGQVVADLFNDFGDPVITTNTWYHVAAVYDAIDGLADTMKIYVNGVERGSSTYSGERVISNPGHPLVLGAYYSSPYQLNGLLDEVSLYDIALSQASIQSIHLMGSGGKTAMPTLPGTYSATGLFPGMVTPPGTYAPAGSTAPIPSPAGRYIPFGGASSIDDAIISPPGTYAPVGSSEPTISPAGYYAPEGSSAPILSPAGYYAPEGSGAPILSPAGYYAPAGSAVPLVTPAGTYSESGAAAAIVPANGFTAPGGGDSSSVVPAKTVELISGNLLVLDLAANPNTDQIRLRLGPNGELIFSDPLNLIRSDIPGSVGTGTHTIAIPFSLVGSINSIALNAGEGNDRFIIDFSSGNPIPSAGLYYDGGSQSGVPGDSLELTSGWTELISTSVTGPTQGIIVLSSTISGTIHYIETEAIVNELQIGFGFSEVVGQFAYHAGSSFDLPGNIQNALDTGKQIAKESAASQQLGFSNLINTTRGINGLVFDIAGLPSATLTPADFQFQWSPQGAFSEGANAPSSWQAAPAPTSITVLPGATPRVVLTWPDQAIMNRWLRVTLKANANTGLPEPEVYYVGHLRGETTGPSTGVFSVSYAQDLAPIRLNLGTNVGPESIFDIDKNGLVQFADIVAMRINAAQQLTQITIPAAGGGGGGGFVEEDGLMGSAKYSSEYPVPTERIRLSNPSMQAAAYAASVDGALDDLYSTIQRRRGRRS